MDQLNDKLPESLERAMAQLELAAARSAAQVDPARVADGVLRRLREGPVDVPRPWWKERWVRVAATVALLAGVGAALLVGGRHQESLAGAGGDSVTVAQVEALLQGVDEMPAADSVPVQDITVDDLTASELQTLLQTMESSEGTL